MQLGESETHCVPTIQPRTVIHGVVQLRMIEEISSNHMSELDETVQLLEEVQTCECVRGCGLKSRRIAN
jgi:hypothetical protein